MEEIIDIIDEFTEEPTGKTISKDEAHKKGIWHSSIHILIVNKEHTKTLLQKRCSEKKLYPNTWDIAVGGHISTNEKPEDSAKRELTEELGLTSSIYNLKFLEKTKEQLINNGIISNEFVYIYVIYANINISNIKLQTEEVSDVKWYTKEELNNLIKEEKLVPHLKDYEILNQILK